MDGYCISPDVSISQCLHVMRELDIGSVVVAQDKRIKGLVSERVITREVCERLNDIDLDSTPVSEVMDVNIILTSPQTSIEEAMNIFTYKRTRYLLVVDDSNELLGVVSIGDVTKWLIEEFNLSIADLSSQSSAALTADYTDERMKVSKRH